MNGYQLLKNNLIDIVKEEQAKLGYRKEAVRLYYPESSIKHLLKNEPEIEYLEHEPDYFVKVLMERLSECTKNNLGKVIITCKNRRFCFIIPEEGTEYVYKNSHENEFIKKLVNIISGKECNIDKIIALFKEKSENVHVEKINNEDFDYLIYFTDIEDDKYYYCFKNETFHMIYHRFLKEDFYDLML